MQIAEVGDALWWAAARFAGVRTFAVEATMFGWAERCEVDRFGATLHVGEMLEF
jgi:hypothetical protein